MCDSSPVCLVTGGTKGIGGVISKHMFSRGARVVALSRDENNDAWSDDFLSIPISHRLHVRGDVSVQGDHARAFARARQRWGSPCTLLVANAGIFGSTAGMGTMDARAFDKVLSVNTKGIFLGVAEFVQFLKSHKVMSTASVVVVGSIYGSQASILANPAYVASKHAAKGLMKFAALEFAQAKDGIPKIRVNCVSPAFTPSNMTSAWLDDASLQDKVSALHPIGAWSSARDVAAAVSYLSLDAGESVTGEDIFVDGGVHIESVPQRRDASEFTTIPKYKASDGSRKFKVVVWCFSNNKSSKNRGLSRIAVSVLKDLGAIVDEIEPANDVDVLPPYRQHTEETFLVDSSSTVARLRQRIAAADALLIATPTYNGSIPGVAKNAIDWLSRGCCTSTPSKSESVFIAKLIAHMGVGWGDGTFHTRERALNPILAAACHPSSYIRLHMDRNKDVQVDQIKYKDCIRADGSFDIQHAKGKTIEKRVRVLCERILEQLAERSVKGERAVEDEGAVELETSDTKYLWGASKACFMLPHLK